MTRSEEAEQKHKRIQLATPIQPYNSDNQCTTQEELISDNEDNNLFVSENSQLSEISQITEVTAEDVNDDPDVFSEENDEDNFNQNESSSNEILEFELGGRITHLADDLLAKWNLLDLFNNSLEAPVSFAF
ncbi:2113_t:CDS:2 [Scutellospora calospora]|uniref:2113_t:CDS:1 n=1 Tax=Scutellospora calospora TaxID=85575 RepID=A0ACA9LI21_9GLOM|nr:2113_t:CDS:2 [Scutellospora calospora]